MKIALVIDSLARGGAERQALNAACELGRRGCDVELIYYYEEAVAYDPGRLAGCAITFLPKDGRYLGFLWRLYAHLRRGRFDVVHAFKSGASIYGCLAARLAGTPVVFGGLRAEYVDRGLVHVLHRQMSRFLTAWIVNSYAVRASASKAIGARPSSFFIVYNAIDPEQFVSPLTREAAKTRIGLHADSPVVSIIARLHPLKNHAMFLDMARLVLQQHPHVCFLIVGDGELRSPLEARARALGIADHVRFLGLRTDIPDLLAATDVSVLTSHSEGFSNSLLESMAVAVPVVTTNYPSAAEVVTHGLDGFLIPRGNVRACAEKVTALLGDAALRHRIGENARQTATQCFSSSAMGASLLEVYTRCLAQMPASAVPRSGRLRFAAKVRRRPAG